MRGGWLYHFETRSCTPKESWRKFWSPSWVWLSDWELWKWHTFQDIVSRPKAATWFRVNQCSENLSGVADLIPSPTSGLEKSGIWSYEAVHHKHFPICTSWNIPGPGIFFGVFVCIKAKQSHHLLHSDVHFNTIKESTKMLTQFCDPCRSRFDSCQPRNLEVRKPSRMETVARRGLRGCDCYASSHDIAWNCGTFDIIRVHRLCLNHKPKFHCYLKQWPC